MLLFSIRNTSWLKGYPMQRDYSILRRLRSGEIVELDGVLYQMVMQLVDCDEWVEAPIGPGDTYIAKRNVAPRVLTAKVVDYKMWCIHPVENAYSYDIPECVRVEVVRKASPADRTAFTGPTAEELRRLAAQPFDINNLDHRSARRLLFRDWAAHCTHDLIATDLLEDGDGTWLIMEAFPNSRYQTVVTYHPENRSGSYKWGPVAAAAA
jgi:hypothetical protein